jgi:hypothetical protein
MQEFVPQKARQRMRVVLVTLLVCSLAACASGDRRSQSLQDTLDAYQKMLRWGDFTAAMQFLHPDHMPSQREAALIMKRFEQIQMNGYQVKSQAPASDKETFLQTAEVSFANRHNMVVRTIEDPQVWRWVPERERWMLISGLPDITRR